MMQDDARKLLPGDVVAVVAVAGALAVRFLLDPLLDDQFPFVTFFAAVVVASWYGGFRAGLLATVLGLLLAWYFFTPPRYTLLDANGPRLVGLARYLLGGLTVAGFGGVVRAARRRSRQSQQAAEEQRQRAAALDDDLHRRLEELDALLRVLPVGVFVAHDRACTSITTNPAGAEMLGIDPAANASKTGPTADGLPFRVLKDGVEVPGEDLPMQRAARTGETVRGEVLEVERADGSVRSFYEYAVPLHDEAGKLRGCLGVLVDITERKRAEEALRESEEKYRRIVETANEGIWALDADARITFVNRRMAEMLGYSPEELLGRRKWDFVAEGELERVRELFERRRAGVSEQADVCFRHKSGRPVWVNMAARPVTDARGVFRGSLDMFTDVTARRQAEETVRSLLRISKRLNSTLDVDALLDVLVQEAIALVGAESGVSGLRAPEGMVCKRYFLKGQAVPLEYCWPPMHGLPGWLIVHKVPYVTNDALRDTQIVHELCVQFGVWSALSTPIVSAQGEVLGFFEVHNKVDGSGFTPADQELLLAVSQAAAIAVQNALAYRAVRQARESLEEADRHKDEFLATLAHELRNPLAPLRNGLQLLRLAGGNGAIAERARDMMERQLQQMVRLIDDLLDVSRISRGKLQLHKRRVPLAEVVASALETCHATIEAAGHELNVALPDQPVYLDADPTRLAQAFANLLSNACKYTERGGRIRLAAERQGGEVVVSVRDTGVGIPPPMLDRIFEMFIQVDQSLERSHGGLGIGLTIVKRLVEMHGGTVEARSEGPGRGSEFLVRLPTALTVVRDEGGEGPGAAVVEPPAGVSARRRILVADDNRDSAESLALMLGIMGNEVITARDGREAVDLAAAHRPEVALLDIGMPKVNGYDAARLIRQQPWGQGMVLIALTGWGQEEDKRRSREAGFDHHLVKPVEPATLERLLALSRGAAG